ncbi:hypothetical protein B0I35DRAFT_481737 [Stachybotrys elegans]|uniref:Uncharacterized protein n=1 Tax=Stachybotrys elegans TaxID=80388 RepID=A0A8K0WND7_9HYPO|nr:hypothetical protein B0I35DRAFT_481737 [Stachybotrys elegans]
MDHAPQPFSISTRVHPAILPHLGQPKPPMPMTPWVRTVAVASVLAYGAKVCVDMAAERRSSQARALEDDAARRRRNEMLMNEYGDRSSLAELERAVQFYEKK